MKIQQVIDRINELMARFVTQVKGFTALGQTDINKIAENVLVPVFSEVYGYKGLKNLNYSETDNYPGVDLGDVERRVSIQVTSTSTSQKVEATLTAFVRHKLYEQYDRLIVYVLTEKKTSYTSKRFAEIVDGKFDFDPRTDIQDHRDLLRDISHLPTDSAQRVLQLLEADFGDDKRPVFLDDNRESLNTLVIECGESDADFAQWLTAQLTIQGYRTWCSLFDTKPGDPVVETVRDRVETQANRYLFVHSVASNEDPARLLSLRHAYEVSQRRQSQGFVIPLLISSMQDDKRNILLRGTYAIDFVGGWSTGLDELVEFLRKNAVQKDPNSTPDIANEMWRQRHSESKIALEAEELLSNWFPIRVPDVIHFHELRRQGLGHLGVDIEQLPYPGVQHNTYLITFAEAKDFNGKLGESISIKATVDVRLDDFLNGQYDQKLIHKDQAWKVVVALISDGWGRKIDRTKLRKYQLANNRTCHFFPIGFGDGGESKSFFAGVNGRRSWRSLAGKHRIQYWHFAIQGRVSLHPEPVLIVTAHALASSDGVHVWENKEKLHAVRRSWFKNWWNAEWRDRLLAAMAFLANESGSIEVPVGSSALVIVSSEPLLFRSPTTYIDPRDDQASGNSETDADDQTTGDDLDEAFGNDLGEAVL